MKVVPVAATTVIDLSETGYVEQRPPAGVSLGSDVDELAEAAGRCCYQSWGRPNPATATNRGYLANIISSEHFSVLEHGSVTFYVSGVSRSLLLELERHRFLSFSVLSQRFVDESGARFIKPPNMDADLWEEMETLYLDGVRQGYGDVVTYMSGQGYTRKQAREAARAVLPGATETKFFVTGNIRTWREIIQKRSSPGADAEIQLFAATVLAELKKLAPNSVQDLEEEDGP